MESTFALPNLPFIPPSLSSLSSTSTIAQPATIKMEDLETNNSSSSRALSFDHSEAPLDSSSLPTGSPSSANSDHKSSKKRRSWGQVLPEPTTNLPPRKRAKTADEKEQRRIERVKRNRLAAHNSRERKRQEVEALQILNQDLEDKFEKMRELAAQQEAQLRYYRQLCPDAVSGAPFASSQASLDKILYQSPLESLATALSKPFNASKCQQASPLSPGLPNLTSANATPDSLAHTLDSFSMPSTPSAEYAPGADLTQHSAAMLCDLQCQSDSRRALSSAMATTTSTTASPCSQASAMIFFLLLILNSLTICSAISAATSTCLTMSRYFPRLLTSPFTLRSLCRQPSSSRSPKTIAQTPQTMWVDLLMACLPIRSPAQAQQFLLATSLALRRSNGLKPSTLGSSKGLSLRHHRGSSLPGLEARFREILASRRRSRANTAELDPRWKINDWGLK